MRLCFSTVQDVACDGDDAVSSVWAALRRYVFITSRKHISHDIIFKYTRKVHLDMAFQSLNDEREEKKLSCKDFKNKITLLFIVHPYTSLSFFPSLSVCVPVTLLFLSNFSSLFTPSSLLPLCYCYQSSFHPALHIAPMHHLQVEYGEWVTLPCNASAYLEEEEEGLWWEAMGEDVAILQGEELIQADRFKVSRI